MSHKNCCHSHQENCCHHDDSCCNAGHHHHHDHEHFADRLLALADEAWMELLKDKIKAEILAIHGDQLDKVAKVVSGANSGRWQHKLAADKNAGNYRQQLGALFCGESCKTQDKCK